VTNYFSTSYCGFRGKLTKWRIGPAVICPGAAQNGVIVFWPALFFIGGDKQNAAELARLKGEMDAVEQASIRKKCGIQFQTTPSG
jgi:hypothetical protein